MNFESARRNAESAYEHEGETPKEQGTSTATAEKILGTQDDPCLFNAIKLVEILDHRYQIRTSENGITNRVVTLSDNELEQAREFIDQHKVTPRHMATLTLGREFEAITRDQEIAWELEYRTDVVKAKLLDNLALKMPFEYFQYAHYLKSKAPETDSEQAEAWKAASESIGQYLRARMESKDELFALSPEGRAKFTQALKTLRANYYHADWDHIIEKAINLLDVQGTKHIDQIKFNEEFEKFLSEAHGNNVLLEALATGDQQDVDTCMALLAIRNSNAYGIRKTWNFLPTDIKEMLKTDQLALFEAGTRYGPYDILQTVSSITRAHTFNAMYGLAKAVYNLETNTEDKARLQQALLKEGIDISVPRYQARAAYEQRAT
jgi:hypothetical protein